MLDFRKVFLAAAVAGLGLVGTASAQSPVTYGAGGTYGFVGAGLAALRAEGVTEQVPSSVIGGLTAVGGVNASSVSFIVTTSAPITNLLLTGTITNQTDAYAGFVAWNGGVGTTNVAGVLVNSTTLQFTLTGLGIGTAPGTITINNIRVDVHNLAVGTSVTTVPSGVATGNLVFTTTPTALTEGITQTSLAKPTFVGYANIAACTMKAADLNAVGVVTISDAYSGAFTTDVSENAKEAGAGAVLSTLSNPAFGTAIGTRLAVTFSNLGSGLNYYLPAVITNAPFVLTMVTGATSATPATAVTVPGTGSTGNLGAGNALTGVVQLAVSGGSATAYYAVTGSNFGLAIDTTAAIPSVAGPPVVLSAPQIAAFTTVTLYESGPVPASIVAPAGAPTVTVTVTGNTAPLYTQMSAPAPTVITAAAKSTIPLTGAGLVSACNTTLLFPYLLTSSGYDTGIAFTNAGPGTSTLVGNTFTATTSGLCNLSLWGSATLNGAAITPLTGATAIPVTIAAGQVYANNLSALLPAGNPTFVGYGVASCNFIGAHAFAQISNGAGGLSEGYLAPVLTDVYAGVPGALANALF